MLQIAHGSESVCTLARLNFLNFFGGAIGHIVDLDTIATGERHPQWGNSND
jgi:hypothetical protein